MSEVKQVKVDNWGIYFLQRLKHFFNRTDYCDLTLQFQDNAQLKVHRLVLNACTEYFELLERTCEMYEDCLVMPDDLQADVVVPIVNFMYTGHLEFRLDLLERLYQTSQILNMPVLTKLLESHRMALKTPIAHNYGGVKRYTKASEAPKIVKPLVSNKRSYSKAFDNKPYREHTYRDKKVYLPTKNVESNIANIYQRPTSVPVEPSVPSNKSFLGDPRPTRYELPEELDQDNIFDNSFCNISYTCKPLVVHPENVKSYSSKRTGMFSGASGSNKLLPGTSTVDIVECKKIAKENNIFDDNSQDHVTDDLDMFHSSYNNETVKDTSNLFDQIIDESPKVTIETKDSKAASNLDHAKIISEVLKKYPHLVKSNKNIKLKILSTPTKAKKQPQKTSTHIAEKPAKIKTEEPDYTYESDVIDSQQAAKLIAMGAENTKGPWICLICGTPGRALHFTSYYKFRRHLVEIHNEKPVSNICEYCGLRSLKRNYLLHHLYSQHGVPPPPHYKFPKCNRCSYIALTEGLLVKHKLTHKDIKNFSCNVCFSSFVTTKALLQHIQTTGHKYSAERKANLQCIYCLKPFTRDGNLYAHLKGYHKKEAKNDGIVDDSDDEKSPVESPKMKTENREDKYSSVKYEPSTSYSKEYEVDIQYQIHQNQDGDIQLTPTKQHNVISTPQHKVIPNVSQKILNPGFGTSKSVPKGKPIIKNQSEPSPYLEDINIPPSPTSNDHNEEEIVIIDNNEYIMRDNQLIPRKLKTGNNEYIIADMVAAPTSLQIVQPTTSTEYSNVHNTKLIEETPSRMLIKKTTNVNQPIQIVVSNEEEYKALMASNHPILFDNGDTNKTLTVLTSQHPLHAASTMQSAAINLESTQANDVMIIQDDFPINVSEAISTENSNIVVVYSHPVDDQNKQYQILTTEGIGSQFVESSTIITQNFETVTTSAPIKNVHHLEPQVNTTWQGNVQGIKNLQIPVAQHAELQSINVSGDAVIKQLTEVHLVNNLETNVPSDHPGIETSNELNIVNREQVNQNVQEIFEESQSIPDTQIETEILRAGIMGQETTIHEPMETSHENECISENHTNEVNQDVIIHEPIEHIITAADHLVSSTEEHAVTREGPTEIVEQQLHTIQEHTEQHMETTEELTETADHTETPEEHSETPEEHLETPEEHLETPEEHTETPEEHPETPEEHTDTAEEHPETPEEHSQTTEHIKTAEEAELVPEEVLNHENENIKDAECANLNSVKEHQLLPESQAYDDIVQTNNYAEKMHSPKEADEKIQNLTSEWSEDEYDTPEGCPTEETITKPKDVTEPEQLEETIENIRKEMQNHINTTLTTATIDPIIEKDTESAENLILESTLTGPVLHENAETNLTTAAVQHDPETQQKISSLLNDWEDNDSQEDNNLDVQEAEKNHVSEVTIEKVPNTDNIKNLVSDWDDDEDENKTEQ